MCLGCAKRELEILSTSDTGEGSLRKVHNRTDIERLAIDALSKGARLGEQVGVIPWNTAGRCERPHRVELAGYASPRDIGGLRQVTNDDRRLIVEIDAQCRKCGPCLKRRAALWRMLAMQEIRNCAGRTWFGTLTLSEQEQFSALTRARGKLGAMGIDFEGIGAAEQFQERVWAISPLITKYLKRVRKESGTRIRYLLVAEAHKSGAPHFHLLVHEAGVAPVRHTVLSRQWKHGFSNFKLVQDTRAASYVCKYLAKSAIARVRASQGYGQASLAVCTATNEVGREHHDPSPKGRTDQSEQVPC